MLKEIASIVEPTLQIGFAAIMAYLLFKLIKDLFPRILACLEDNAGVLEKLAQRIDANTAATDRQTDILHDVDRRLVEMQARDDARDEWNGSERRKSPDRRRVRLISDPPKDPAS